MGRGSQLSPGSSHSGIGRRARFLRGCGSSRSLAVHGFCTLNNCVQMPLHGTWHTWQHRGSLQQPCAAPYQRSIWPNSSNCYGPQYAPSTGPSRPGLVGHTTPSLVNRSEGPLVSSAPWPRPYAPRQTLRCSPSLSFVPSTAFGLGRPQASAGPTSTSRAGLASTIARPIGGGS